MSHGFIRMNMFLLALVFLMSAGWTPQAQADLALVKDGKNALPIVIFKDAPLWTRHVADELALYIEQASGVRPDVIEGEPSPLPEKAIWVGFQPAVAKLFPNVNFSFEHPEEILFASNDHHLVIAGRDRWDPEHMEGSGRGGRVIVPGVQQEYGTVNAVYTFLQDQMGVRFFYPGPGGEDVPKQTTLTVENLNYRYHPQFRQRETFMRFASLEWSTKPPSGDWVRRQRLQLDSFDAPVQGHGFGDWWERFHETNPGYFALQPDGTRSGFPAPSTAKLCDSNPEVWEQWVNEVAAHLEKDPNQTVFSGVPNDSYHRGHCVCDNCRAWDHPDAEKLNFVWQGVSQLYPAITDRHLTFANMLGRKLKERFPDKKLYVLMYPYGNARPAPVAARPDDNVIVCGVHNFHLRDIQTREKGLADLHAWSKVVSSQMWRPNLGGGTVGWTWGLPDISPTQAIHDIRLVADAGGTGISFDSVWEHWANQGIHYYMMAQMIWNPYQDGQALLEDYYQRAYGPAYDPMKAYWTRLEQIRDGVANDPEVSLVFDIAMIYSPEVISELTVLLDQAQVKAASADKGFQDRIAFARVGLEHLKNIVAIRTLMLEYENGGMKDEKLAQQIDDLWVNKVHPMRDQHPEAINWQRLGRGQGRWQTGLHPKNAVKIRRGPTAAANRMKGKDKKVNTDAQAAGWNLAHEDDFSRTELGEHWTIARGQWVIENNQLVGSGLLLSTRGFPGGDALGYQRLEYDITSIPWGTTDDAVLTVCDASAILNVKPMADDQTKQLNAGYFFQFGGFNNTRNALRKLGNPLVIDRQPTVLITPRKTQRVIVENDQGKIRMIVDGSVVLEWTEKSSLMGNGQDHVGFYTETRSAIDNVKIYVKQIEGGLDLE